MKNRLAIVVALIVIVIIGVVVLRYFQGNKATATSQYETVPARRDTILATVSASGSITPKEQVTLNFPIAGVIAEVNVKAGQKVEAGQQLVRLDTRQLQASVEQAEATLRINEARLAQVKAGSGAADIAAAEAAVASAQALYESAKNKLGLRSEQLSIAEADLKKAELALQDAQSAYDRAAWRPEIGMLPQSANLQRATLDYQRALANYKLQVAAIDDTSFKSAAAQLAQAKAQLDKLQRAPTPEDLAVAQAQVDQAKAALAQAKLRLDDAILRAPFAGTVLSCNARVGEMANAATAAVVLGDLQSYYIATTVDETDVGRLQVGQDATITLDAFPEVSLRGKVTSIDLLGKSVQGVVSYAAEIEVLPTEVAIRPGMTAIADIVVAKKEGVITVPNRAVKRDSRGKYYVEVLSNGKVQQRFVSPGLSNELMTELTSGVDEGEEVVVSAPRRNVLTEVGGSPFRFR